MSDSTQTIRNQRRPKGYVSSIATNFIHQRNPWVTTCWSAAFPGFGHIILGSYAKGFLLIIWELFINVKAQVNESGDGSSTQEFKQTHIFPPSARFL